MKTETSFLESKSELGRFINQVIFRRNLSSREAAKLTKVSSTVILRIMRNDIKDIKIDTLASIIERLGYLVDFNILPRSSILSEKRVPYVKSVRPDKRRGIKIKDK